MVRMSGAQAMSMNLLQFKFQKGINATIIQVLRQKGHCSLQVPNFISIHLDVKKGKDFESMGSGVRRPMRALEKGPIRQSAV